MSPINPHSLVIRTLSAIVYAALVISALSLKTPILFAVLFAWVAIVCTVELNMLTRVFRTRPMRVALDGIMVVWHFWAGMLWAQRHEKAAWLLIPTLVYVLYILGRSLFTDRGKEMERIGNSLIAVAYLGIPFFLMGRLSYYGGVFYGAQLLPLFMIIWLSDTGAYFAGSLWGKHKLYPSISPKKSVEGLLGGLVLATLCGGLVTLGKAGTYFFHGRLSVWEGLLLGLFVAAAGVLGDLFESLLKRNANVKDSGRLIPGHGGYLDRFDSLLFALPAGYIFLRLFY